MTQSPDPDLILKKMKKAQANPKTSENDPKMTESRIFQNINEIKMFFKLSLDHLVLSVRSGKLVVVLDEMH